MKTSFHILLAGLAFAAGCTLINDPGKLEPGPDTTPPPAPTGLTATPGNTTMTLAWDPVNEWDFDHYAVYYALTGQTLAAAGDTQGTTFGLTGLDNALVYDFVVVAVDRFGNFSDASTLVTAQPDGVPPTVAASYNPGPAVGANLMTDVIFTFSEPMDTATILGNAAVTRSTGSTPVCAWTFFNGDREAKCDLVLDGDPSKAFGYNETCTVTLGSGVTDKAGNALVGAPFTASFTTAAAPDTKRPTFTSVTVATSASSATVVGTGAPGATAVYPETNVVITFSEAMNQTVTQGAITVNGGVGYNGGSFTWDATGSVVTFNPDLEYPAGRTVTVTIGLAAADLAGNTLGDASNNPLVAPVTRTFRVANQATETLYSEALIDGYGYSVSGGTSVTMNGTGSYMYAGDSSASDGQYAGFMSFPLTALSHTPTRYRVGTLSVYQVGCTGTPYTDLRRLGFCIPLYPSGLKCFYTYLLASHVNLGASLDVTDFTTPVLSGSWQISSTTTVGLHSVDVNAALESDRQAGRARSQWRLAFPIANDAGADNDYCYFYTSDYATSDLSQRPHLDVTYEYP